MPTKEFLKVAHCTVSAHGSLGGSLYIYISNVFRSVLTAAVRDVRAVSVAGLVLLIVGLGKTQGSQACSRSTSANYIVNTIT